MRVRNNPGFKSRNTNFSLSENRENNTTNLPQYSGGGLEFKARNSIGDNIITNNRNYESDTSLFNDIKNNMMLNENSSFNE